MRVNKEVVIGEEARAKMSVGVDKLADAVKATLGPRGRNVAIERDFGPPIVTKDGVTVARYINLSDNIENMGAQLVKSVAASANNIAGDGTTTATVLAQSIYHRGIKEVEEGRNPVFLKRGIDYALGHVLEYLDLSTIGISDEENIRRVATISANNDHELGSIIAEAACAVGKDGLISVEEAAGHKTSIAFTEGIKLDRGMLSHEFITNPNKLTAELNDAHILCYSDKLNNIQELTNLLNEEFVGKSKSLLLIVKDIDIKALQLLVLNQIQGNINCCVIKAPGFGDTMKAMLEDVSVLTGGQLVTNDDGNGLNKAKAIHLGKARKITVGLNSTTIVDGYSDKNTVKERVDGIQSQIDNADDLFEHQLENLQIRLARLSGSVAVIRVGGPSESEMRERKDRVEDAVNAVFSALEEGVVSGGGSQLLRAGKSLEQIDTSGLLEEEIAGVRIVKDALSEPFIQILKNSGMQSKEIEQIKTKILKSKHNHAGFDAYSMKFENDLFEKGVIDPTKVIKTALEKAISASGTLLTTEVSISLEKKED